MNMKVFMYCTQTGKDLIGGNKKSHADFLSRYGGKVVGEFSCEKVHWFDAEFVDEKKHGFCYEDICRCSLDEDGEIERVVITANDDNNPNDCWLCKKSCLTFEQIKAYVGPNFHEKSFYGLEISNMVAYETPQDLGVLYTVDEKAVQRCVFREQIGQPEDKTQHCGWIKGSFVCNHTDDWCTKCKTKPISKPPQSWCYANKGILLSLQPFWLNEILSGRKTLEIRKTLPTNFASLIV